MPKYTLSFDIYTKKPINLDKIKPVHVMLHGIAEALHTALFGHQPGLTADYDSIRLVEKK